MFNRDVEKILKITSFLHMLCKLPRHMGQAAVPTGELVFPVSGPVFEALAVKPDPRVLDPLIHLWELRGHFIFLSVQP